MTTPTKVPLDLVGVKEIADMFGVHQVTAGRWRARGELPEPDAFLPKRPLWLRANIEAWAAEVGRSLVA